jgi:twinfilin
VKISIADETITLDSIINCQSSPQEDFDGPLRDSLVESDASLVVFCMDVRNTTQPTKWILLAWVPDNCRVRDKMLYSSSREDLRKSLGLGYFTGEYYANSKSDLTWEQLVQYSSRDRTDGPLTVKEQLILEEKVTTLFNCFGLYLIPFFKAMTHVESNTTKASAMGALPFSLSDDVVASLSRLGAGEVNWVEMYLGQGETVQLAGAKGVDTSVPLSRYVSSTDARYHTRH